MSTYSKTADSFRCDECGKPMAFPLFCDECGTDYPERRGMSAFGILGLPRTFEIEASEIERRELLLAQRLHPDRWQGRGDRLYKRALLAQSAVNEALGQVSDPFTRSSTLLDLQEDAVPHAQLPQAFLMEQLELQEEIEEGVESGRKRELKKAVRAELKSLRASLAEAWLTAADGDASALATVQELVDRSRYWKNAEVALRGQAPG